MAYAIAVLIIDIINEKCTNTDLNKSLTFINWLISKRGQKLIDSYRINGMQLFYPSIEMNKSYN